MSREVSLDESDEGLALTRGQKVRRIVDADVKSMIRMGDHVWLFLRDGRTWRLELPAAAAAALEKRYGDRALLTLEPNASGSAAIVALLAMTGSCSLGIPLVNVLSTPDVVAIPIVLGASMIISALVARFYRGAQLRVGRDGLRIGQRFVAYASIVDVKAAKNAITLILDDESEIRVRVSMSHELAHAVQALLRKRVRSEPVEAGDLAQREGEGVRAWIQRLRRYYASSSLREAARPEEDAKEILRAAKAPLRVRVAAATALAEKDGGEIDRFVSESLDPQLAELQELLADDEALAELLEAQ